MRFRIRLALTVGFLSFTVGGLVLLAVFSRWEKTRRHEQETQLRTTAQLLLPRLPEIVELPPETRNRRVEELGDLVKARVTVVRGDGRVVADSQVPYAHLGLLENHGQRPEIRRALDYGEGAARRRSSTTGLFTYYVAVRAQGEDQPWVVRVAREEKPTPWPWLGLLLVGVGSLGVGWMSQRVVARWQRLVYQHLASWSDLPPEAETPAVAFEADRRFRAVQEATNRELQACRQALSQVEDGVVLIDREQIVRFANPRAMEYLGPLPDGCPLWEHCLNPQLVTLVSETLANGGSRHAELSYNGRTLAVTVNALQHPVLALAILVRDLSPQVRFEAARRAFVADLAHELRTPVTVLGGVFEELRERGGARELVDMLGRQVQRLARFASDLEELARIETGRVELTLGPIALLPLAEEVAADWAARAREAGVSLAVEGQGMTVTSDRMRLAQVINNLVDNAIRYNRPGGRVVIRVVPRPEGAQVIVEDTGVGIPESEIPLVFQRFYRVRREGGGGGGSGLGLAIVKHLIAVLGGTVHLKSRLGEGTQVTVEVPLRPSPEPDAPSKPSGELPQRL